MQPAAASHPVIPGAEAWQAAGAPGHDARRAATGVGLIHGFTGNPVSMRPLAEQLHTRGFRVDVPRLPGHGTHYLDMLPTRYADWRAEVVRTVERLQGLADRVVLVGLSMGGALVLDVASAGAHPIAGVVTINTQFLSRTGLAVKLGPYLERLMPLALPQLAGLRKDDIAKPHVTEHAYTRVPSAAGSSFLRELPRIREQLPKLSVPALIAYSRQDHSVPPENSKAVLGLLPASQARELVLERSYHVATLDYDLEPLAEAIASFCDSF
ncbi:MAG TPA: alpha/beta fold hydrolase [Polyangiaceae bacterium]|nr:alpha/beta fold hydrolase [Polyangiaceae bacterium]